MCFVVGLFSSSPKTLSMNCSFGECNNWEVIDHAYESRRWIFSPLCGIFPLNDFYSTKCGGFQRCCECSILHWKMIKFEDILLMEEIQHQLIGRLSQYVRGSFHPRWLAGFLPSAVRPYFSNALKPRPK